MIRSGVDPDLLGEISWWQTDDLWPWALDALALYFRAVADRTAARVASLCHQLAPRHRVELSPGT